MQLGAPQLLLCAFWVLYQQPLLTAPAWNLDAHPSPEKNPNADPFHRLHVQQQQPWLTAPPWMLDVPSFAASLYSLPSRLNLAPDILQVGTQQADMCEGRQLHPGPCP